MPALQSNGPSLGGYEQSRKRAVRWPLLAVTGIVFRINQQKDEEVADLLMHANLVLEHGNC